MQHPYQRIDNFHIHIDVVDKSGNVIVNSSNSKLHESPIYPKNINTNTLQVSEHTYNHHPILVIKKSLYMGSELWGVLTLYFSQTELEKKVLNYSRQMEDNDIVQYCRHPKMLQLFFIDP